MKNTNQIWGVLIIIIGVVLGLNAVDLLDISIFFKGWWTLFIILPALISMLQNGLKSSNGTVLAIGVLFFLAERDILAWGLVSGLIWPLVIVGIGFSLLFQNEFAKFSIDTKQIREKNKDGIRSYSAVFSGQEVKIPNEKFDGAVISAVFGGVDLDLRDAIIDQDIILDVSAVFGGVDILVSSDVAVKVNCSNIFGGVDNKSKGVQGEGVHTIYINGSCIFGGIDIK